MSLNDLNEIFEISCVCEDFYHLCANNHFYVKKTKSIKENIRGRSCLLCHYKQLCENFYYSLFRKLVTYVSIENLIAARKILFFAPFSCLEPFISLL